MSELNVFEKFKKTAFRVEMQPVYDISIEQKNFTGFKNGYPLDPKDNIEWIESIKNWVQDGKEIKRVRVIDEQLSLYEKYEFICYHKNDAVGEKINVISRQEYNRIADKDLHGDFWIFDDEFVAKLIYEKDGKFLKLDIIEEKDLVKRYSKLFRNLSENIYGDYKKIVKQINLSPVKITFD